MKESPLKRAISQNDKLLDLRTGQFLRLHFTVLACGQDILPISIFWRGLLSRSELFAIETSKVQFVPAFSQNPLMVILLTFSPPFMEELYHRKEVFSMKKTYTNKDIEDGKKISALFSTLSEENKTMAIVYLSALRDKEIADSSKGKEMAVV